jgi:hypothetical protein
MLPAGYAIWQALHRVALDLNNSILALHSRGHHSQVKIARTQDPLQSSSKIANSKVYVVRSIIQ